MIVDIWKAPVHELSLGRPQHWSVLLLPLQAMRVPTTPLADRLRAGSTLQTSGGPRCCSPCHTCTEALAAALACHSSSRCAVAYFTSVHIAELVPDCACREQTLHWAIFQQLKSPSPGFEEVIKAHFRLQKNAIEQQVCLAVDITVVKGTSQALPMPPFLLVTAQHIHSFVCFADSTPDPAAVRHVDTRSRWRCSQTHAESPQFLASPAAQPMK